MQAVLLDRDGVINMDSDSCICSPQQWHPIPGSLQAIAMLKSKGIVIGVATNQRAIARGLFGIDTLEKIHQKMHQQLASFGASIDALRYCPHDYHHNCNCRKPKPGMVLALLKQLRVVPQHACMVGDKIDDVRAARSAGVQPILVLTGKGQSTLVRYRDELADVPIYPDLARAVDGITACYNKKNT